MKPEKTLGDLMVASLFVEAVPIEVIAPKGKGSTAINEAIERGDQLAWSRVEVVCHLDVAGVHIHGSCPIIHPESDGEISQPFSVIPGVGGVAEDADPLEVFVAEYEAELGVAETQSRGLLMDKLKATQTALNELFTEVV